MATPTSVSTVYVRYIGSLKHWKDAVFNVPIANVIKTTGESNLLPLVGDIVFVKKENRFGRVRKWKGVVVSEMDLMEGKRLMEINDIDSCADELLEESPIPPGSVSPSPAAQPPRKRARIQGMHTLYAGLHV